MSILTVRSVSHGFGDRALLNDVSFRLLKGEHVGLVGANGEGKSTFMNIIIGSLQPDEGSIEWAKRVRVGYLDQQSQLENGVTVRDHLRRAFQYLFDWEKDMNNMYEKMAQADEQELTLLMEEVGIIQDLLTHNDFYIIDAKIDEVAQGLGLSDIGLDTAVDALSGGQRTKIRLAKLLLEKPDILLLDEPTNHLDEEHINWLRRYLQNYENAFIVISHDIPFLNEVINLIYHVENQNLNRYVGNYDDFMAVYATQKKQADAAYKKQQQEIAALEDFVARNKARVATRNMAKSRQKKLDKMDRLEQVREKPKPTFSFQTASASSRVVFETKNLVIGYESPLTRPLNLTLLRGQKIALTGANGLGKTTLIRTLTGALSPLSGQIFNGDTVVHGYFEQEGDSNNSETCIETLWRDFPGLNQYEIRSALAKCGLTTKHIESQVRVLSGGEQAKLRMCRLVNTPTNVLFLDEPTNHLDQDAKNALRTGLESYPGTLFLICHEPHFYQGLVSEVWNCEDWTTKIF